MPPVLTTKQAADILQCSVVYIRELILNKGLPAFKIGDEYRIVFAQLMAWCELQAAQERQAVPVNGSNLPARRGRRRKNPLLVS